MGEEAGPDDLTQYAGVLDAETQSVYAWGLADEPDEPAPARFTPSLITAAAVAASLAVVTVAGVLAWRHLRVEETSVAATESMVPATMTQVTTSASPVALPSPAPKTTQPPAPVALPAPSGSAWVGTQSGKTFCQVTAGSVTCLVEFAVATPIRYGTPANGVSVSIVGDFEWTIGDRGQQPVETLRYGTTYRAAGWTIKPTSEGTSFINDTTGHGMTVSVEGVTPF